MLRLGTSITHTSTLHSRALLPYHEVISYGYATLVSQQAWPTARRCNYQDSGSCCHLLILYNLLSRYLTEPRAGTNKNHHHFEVNEYTRTFPLIHVLNRYHGILRIPCFGGIKILVGSVGSSQHVHNVPYNERLVAINTIFLSLIAWTAA